MRPPRFSFAAVLSIERNRDAGTCCGADCRDCRRCRFFFRHDLARILIREIDDRFFLSEVRAAARFTGIDEKLFIAMVYVESRFEPKAVSRAGAVGLAQVMPATAIEIAKRSPQRIDGAIITAADTSALFSPRTNLRIGAIFLRELLDRFSDTNLALAAYNGGPKAVEEWMKAQADTSDLSTFPKEETRRYVHSVNETRERITRFSRMWHVIAE